MVADVLKPMTGWCTPAQVRAAYCAQGLGAVGYAAPALFDPDDLLKRPLESPMLVPKHDLVALERAHDNACRAITGTLHSAPSAAVVRCAGFRSIEHTLRRFAIRRAVRAKADRGALSACDADQGLTFDSFAPSSHVTFDVSIGHGVTRESTPQEKRADSMTRIASPPSLF